MERKEGMFIWFENMSFLLCLLFCSFDSVYREAIDECILVVRFSLLKRRTVITDRLAACVWLHSFKPLLSNERSFFVSGRFGSFAPTSWGNCDAIFYEQIKITVLYAPDRIPLQRSCVVRTDRISLQKV